MPGIPTVGSAYDSVFTILNAARFRLNDRMSTLYPTGGKILKETDASTQQAFNNAFRRFQDALCDAGVERFQAETVVQGIPVAGSMDPAAQSWISWFGCFDGVNLFSNPVLPANLILPLWMAERPSVTSSSIGQPWPFPNVDIPNMKMYTDGLPMYTKRQFNGACEWRGDAIYYPGATIQVDFRIRYRAYLPDIVDVGNVRWFNQPVQIMRCLEPLTWWLCTEFATARAIDGDASEQMAMIAAACKTEAINSTKLLANRDVMKNERDDVRRIPYGGGSRGYRGGWGFRG